MSYLAREDGTNFVTARYREVLSAKKKSLFKKQVQLLASTNGDYIHLEQKNAEQWDVAIAQEPGYLLGETVWEYFNSPRDFVFCEVLPNGQDAILVVAKNGSIYLEGSFPLDAVADELIIFKTQPAQFEIFVYGDVPISHGPDDDKFYFIPTSIKSFTVLDKPIFPTLPIRPHLQLKLYTTVLKEYGIGALPIKQIVIGIAVFISLWVLANYYTSHKKELPMAFVGIVNPYQLYFDSLASPDPAQQILQLTQSVKDLYSLPGWTANSIDFQNQTLHIGVTSQGSRVSILQKWVEAHQYVMTIQPDGIYLDHSLNSARRDMPYAIVYLNTVITSLTDRLSYVLPGNHLTLGQTISHTKYSEALITINIDAITPDTLDLIGQQLKDLPLVLMKVNLTLSRGFLSGSIILKALGN